jgi:folylpolyglutamate synthase/dihydropteroate synthase
MAAVLLAPVPSERAATADELRAAAPVGRLMTSLAEALAEADRLGQPIVVAGSLFLAGEALRLLGGEDAPGHPNEVLRKPR